MIVRLEQHKISDMESTIAIKNDRNEIAKALLVTIIECLSVLTPHFGFILKVRILKKRFISYIYSLIINTSKYEYIWISLVFFYLPENPLIMAGY